MFTAKFYFGLWLCLMTSWTFAQSLPEQKRMLEVYKREFQALSNKGITEHIDNTGNPIGQRLEEFQRVSKEIVVPSKLSGLVKTSGAACKHESQRVDISAIPMSSAYGYMTGPNNTILPYNGEVILNEDDIKLPSRGGIGFAFTRRYSSFDKNDYGMGKGWRHSYDIFISELAKDKLLLHLNDRNIEFVKQDGEWITPQHEFLSVSETSKGDFIVQDSTLNRYVFSPAIAPQTWRLSQIASRHGKWSKNTITVNYLRLSDRIDCIIDPFDNKIDFYYDTTGHISVISTNVSYVQYHYNSNGCLMSVLYPDRKNLSSSHKQGINYTYDDNVFLVKKEILGLPCVLTFRYNLDKKVERAGWYTSSNNSWWDFSYDNTMTTVKQPYPLPETIYKYSSSIHASLPSEISQPSIDVCTKYEYNSAALVSKKTTSFGRVDFYEYDLKNPNPSFRSNLMSERSTPETANNVYRDYDEKGKEYQYHNEIALPIQITYYQVKNGKRINIKIDSQEYSNENLTLSQRKSSGITTLYWYNSFGEPAVMLNANGTAILYEYAENCSFPDYGFLEGNCNYPGFLCKKISTNDKAKILNVLKSLNANYSLPSNNLPIVESCDYYSYNCFGKNTRKKNDTSDELYIYNECADLLASFSFEDGLTITNYNAYGKPLDILHQFVPENKDGFQGCENSRFAGRFFSERFYYDDLGLLHKHIKTDEPNEDGSHCQPIVYLRHPSGKVISITSADGMTRVDERSKTTGLLANQYLTNSKGEKIVLNSDFQYTHGVLTSVKNHLGGTVRYLIDGYGNGYAEISPLGVITQETHNVLGQKEAQWSHKNGKELARTENIYNENNQLVSVVVHQYFNEMKTVVTTEEYKYDSLGNIIAKKSTQNNSWEYFLYDGLNREIASITPSGDISLTFWGKKSSYCHLSLLNNGDDYKLTGEFSSFDYAGRKKKTIPITSKGLASERAVSYFYDSVGTLEKTLVTGLTCNEKKQNTLGKVTTDLTTPLSSDMGEKTTITKYKYDANGRLIKKILGNTALALVKKDEGIVAEQKDAPQVTIYSYDSLGRQYKTTQPDGLVLEYIFNENSLPTQLNWYKENAPNEVLRSLSIVYSVLGQCLSITDNSTGKILRQNEYDLHGNCIKSTDFDSRDNKITIHRQFDSVGTKRHENVSFNSITFPTQNFDYDLQSGWLNMQWQGLDKTSPQFWESERYNLDQAGRLQSISLDGKDTPYVTWKYLSTLPISRIVKASSLMSETSYNDFLEPISQTIRNCVDQQVVIGKFDYGYGPQGQSEYSSTCLKSELPGHDDYKFASFTKFDAYRRLIAQNAEQILYDDWHKRSEELFASGASASLVALQTQRMAYDQANNIWVNYSGHYISPSPSNFCLKQNPVFISPSCPISLNHGEVQDLDLKELASNRDVSKATFNSDASSLQEESQIYDSLGCLIEFNGTYWNGIIRRRAKWHLSYDALGRLTHMKGYARDYSNDGSISEGTELAELTFSYDSENRRICKEVRDMLANTTKRTYTLYSGNNQVLVYEEEDGRPCLKEQYLWKPGTRELIMAAMPVSTAQHSSSQTIDRYFFQQDKGQNVVFSSKFENGNLVTVSAMSYLGFGENATMAEITSIRSSLARGAQNPEYAYNKTLDDILLAKWPNVRTQPQFITLQLAGNDKLSSLKIWTAERFPENFLVFVLPQGSPEPKEYDDLVHWIQDNGKYACAQVNNGKCFDFQKTNDWETPYQIPLFDRQGDRIVLIWDHNPLDRIEVREFEVLKVPNNPTAISFAGQLLDMETEMYYQINRYRLAGSNKFISPDPLGDFDGNNLYAYAHNNPLEWHDPDGKFAITYGVSLVLGAGIGAVMGGGMYALNCWMTGQEFNWAEFGVSVFAGAVSGLIAAALLPVNPVLAGFAAGTVGGAIAEGGITYLRTGDWEQALIAAGKGALWGGAAGAFAGSFGLFGNSSNFLIGLSKSVFVGGITGSLFGGARAAVETYEMTGSWENAWLASQQGAAQGGIMGGIAGGAGYSISRIVNGFTSRHSDTRNVKASAYDNPETEPTKARYQSKVDREAFDAAKKPFWKERGLHPRKNDAYVNTKANILRMKAGLAPIGKDGFPVELHHPDGVDVPLEQMKIMTRTEHRLGDNYRNNHPWLFAN